MAEYESAEPMRFPRGIILGWYDGATDGFLEAEPGRRVYEFRMVAWDDRQDSRIYVLRPMPAAATMDALAGAFFGAGFRLDFWRAVMAEDPGEAGLEHELAVSAGPAEFIVLSDDCLETSSGVLGVTGGNRAELESWLLDSPGEWDGFSHSDLPFEHWIALFR